MSNYWEWHGGREGMKVLLDAVALSLGDSASDQIRQLRVELRLSMRMMMLELGVAGLSERMGVDPATVGESIYYDAFGMEDPRLTAHVCEHDFVTWVDAVSKLPSVSNAYDRRNLETPTTKMLLENLGPFSLCAALDFLDTEEHLPDGTAWRDGLIVDVEKQYSEAAITAGVKIKQRIVTGPTAKHSLKFTNNHATKILKLTSDDGKTISEINPGAKGFLTENRLHDSGWTVTAEDPPPPPPPPPEEKDVEEEEKVGG